MSKQQVRRYVVGHDLHFPKVHQPTVECFFEVIDDIKPYGIILGGDQFDNEEISHHNSNKPYYKERRSYLRNRELFERNFLTPLEKLLPKNCEKTYVTGNHDAWQFQFIEEHPEFEGVVDHEAALKIEERGWEIVPLGHSKKVGEINVIHGEVLSGIGNQAGMYPSRKAVELYASNVLAGHTHAPQSFAKISPVEQKKKHMGYINAILGNVNPNYLRSRPTAWLNGFAIIESYDKGFFNCYTVIVNEGICAYGGVRYGA